MFVKHDYGLKHTN